MNKNILWTFLVVFSLFFGQTAFADDQDHSCGCGKKMKEMVQSLKLDDAQQAKLKTIKEQAKANAKANWEQMKALRVQIDQLVQSDKMDESKLDSLIAQKKELFASMMKTKIMTKHQIYTLLTPQQKTQYQEMIKNWKENMKHNHC